MVLGDDEKNDYSSLKTLFYECIFENNSRRNPFIQYGQSRLYKCLIKNWGIPETFFIKSHGLRAGKHAQVMATDCLFIQKGFFECLNKYTITDIFHQDFPILPGFMKAAYANYGGQIKLYNCYKNRWWLYTKNHIGKYMNKNEAIELEKYLEKIVPK